MQEFDLAGLVCARICHDLASPVGAVVNGAEMMRELGGASTDDELTMVEQSAQRAAAMIQFHRLAFGAHREPGATIARNLLRERIAPVLVTSRVNLDWSAASGGEVPLAAARLIALMLLAARAMLGPGGTLTLLVPAGDPLPASVMAEGPRLAAGERQRGWIAGTNRELPESREIEFALLPLAAAAAGARIELIEDPGRLALRAQPLRPSQASVSPAR